MHELIARSLAVVTIGVVLAAAVIVCLYFIFYQEKYETKREKAKALSKWWTKHNANPEYSDYKRDVEHSDIVEYNRVKKSTGLKSAEMIESLI